MKILVRVLVALLCASTFSIPVLAIEYELKADFSPDQAMMHGEARVWFGENVKAGQALSFLLHGELRIESILVKGKEIEFNSDLELNNSDYSMVVLKTSFELPGRGWETKDPVTIIFSGPFHASSARSPSDYMRIDNQGVFLRSIGYSIWFPVFDTGSEPEATLKFRKVELTTPVELKAIFAGDLILDEVKSGKRRTVWRANELQAHAPQVTARPFSVIETEFADIYGLSDEHSQTNAQKIASFTRELIEIYEKSYGAAKTSGKTLVVQNTEYGDIASGNMIGVSDSIWAEFDGSKWYGRTLAHELVHDFVYVSVPIEDPLYAVAKEGLPDYLHLPALAEMFGEDYYDQYLDNVEKDYLQKVATGKHSRGWALPELKPLAKIKDDEIGIYKDVFLLNDRARLFFDYLRRVMGPDDFQIFAKRMVSEDQLTLGRLYQLIDESHAGLSVDARIWLETTEFPDRFSRHRKSQ